MAFVTMSESVDSESGWLRVGFMERKKQKGAVVNERQPERKPGRENEEWIDLQLFLYAVLMGISPYRH